MSTDLQALNDSVDLPGLIACLYPSSGAADGVANPHLKAVWRGSDGESFSVWRGQGGAWLWKDHVTGETGNAYQWMTSCANMSEKEALSALEAFGESPSSPGRQKPRTPSAKGLKSDSAKPQTKPDMHERLRNAQARLERDGLPLTAQARGLSLEQAAHYGLGREGENTLIPVYGLDGALKQVKVRVNEPKHETMKYHYLVKGGGALPWFSPGFAGSTGGTLIVEGELSAMACLSALEAGEDRRGVVGVAGAGGALDWQALTGHEPLWLYTDPDEAGGKCAARLGAQALERGFALRRLPPLQGELDPCDIAHHRGLDVLRGLLLSHMASSPEAQAQPNSDTPTAPRLPRGWAYDPEGVLCRILAGKRDGELEPVYGGPLEVISTGQDIHSTLEALQVRFKVRGRWVEVAAPRAELGKARGVIEHLGGRGAEVHEGNAKGVARFLIEASGLPNLEHHAFTDRYGLTPDRTGLVLARSSVGLSARYVGLQRIHTGEDPNAYPHALRTAATWGAAAWPLWLAVGFSLAAPLLGRLKLRRNPVLYFAGESGVGKTTAAQFAAGIWGDPSRGPLRVEAGRTTRAGLMQTFVNLGGLPAFIDEAHMASKPEDLEAAVYQWANGESYTKGGADGKAKGGEELHGTLLMAGEALPVFKNAGAHRRVLFLEAHLYPPLGAEVGSEEGRRRAALLEGAFSHGAGLLAEQWAPHVWAHWDGFKKRLEEMKRDVLGPWSVPHGAALVALEMLGKLLGFALPPELWKALAFEPGVALERSKEEHDPAAEAWESLLALLQGGKEETREDTVGLFLRGELLAWHPSGEPGRWRVLTNAGLIAERLEGKGWLQRYGATWAKRGLIERAKDGKSSHLIYSPALRQMTRAVVLRPQEDAGKKQDSAQGVGKV